MNKTVLKRLLIFVGIAFLPAIIIIPVVFGLFPDNDSVINISMAIWFFGLFAILIIFVILTVIKNIFKNAMPHKPVPKSKKKRETIKEDDKRKVIKTLDRMIIVICIHSALCILMAIVLVILRFTYFK